MSEGLGITLERTCFACPEQYDAYRDGVQVGYLRLRHGHFTVEVPECGGRLIYEASPAGDGLFHDDERETHLEAAIFAIAAALGLV